MTHFPIKVQTKVPYLHTILELFLPPPLSGGKIKTSIQSSGYSYPWILGKCVTKCCEEWNNPERQAGASRIQLGIARSACLGYTAYGQCIRMSVCGQLLQGWEGCRTSALHTMRSRGGRCSATPRRATAGQTLEPLCYIKKYISHTSRNTRFHTSGAETRPRHSPPYDQVERQKTPCGQ